MTVYELHLCQGGSGQPKPLVPPFRSDKPFATYCRGDLFDMRQYGAGFWEIITIGHEVLQNSRDPNALLIRTVLIMTRNKGNVIDPPVPWPW